MTIFPVPPVLTIEDIADRWCKESGCNFKDIVSAIIRAMNKHENINDGQTSLNAWATASIGPDGEDAPEYYTGLETLDDPAWDLLDYIFSHPLNIPEEEIRKALRLKCFCRDTFLELIQRYGDCEIPKFWLKLDSTEAPTDKAATKMDSIRVEIEDIISQGTPSNTESVWRKMIERCEALRLAKEEAKGSVYLNIEETEKGPVICWRGAKGKMNRLTKKSLAERLRTRNTG